MNQGQFSGYLGRDAELRTTPNGHEVLNFSIGVTVGFGESKKTLWVGCALWGDRAEKLAPYLLKGTPVSVSGDVDLRTWDSRDGKHGAEVTLNVQRVTLMGRGKDEQRPAQQQRQAPAQQSADFDDDAEIPF